MKYLNGKWGILFYLCAALQSNLLVRAVGEEERQVAEEEQRRFSDIEELVIDPQNFNSPETRIRAFEGVLRNPLHLKKLSLARCDIRTHSVDALKRALESFLFLEELDLKDNRITAVELVDILGRCSIRLRKVHFTIRNPLHHPGVNPLFVALGRLIHLEELDFWGIELFERCLCSRDEGPDDFAKMLMKLTSLRRLILAYCGLKARDLPKLEPGFRAIGGTLEELNLKSHEEWESPDYSGLLSLSTLFPHLRIFESRYSSDSCVQNLSLSASMESALEAVEQDARVLNLENCVVCDRSVGSLIRGIGRFASLEELNLRKNHITAVQMVEILRGCSPELRKVYFIGNPLHHSGVTPLFVALGRLVHLEELDFTGIEIFEHNIFSRDEGPDHFADMLKNFHSLRRLILKDCGLFTRDLDKLKPGFEGVRKTLEELDLRDNTELESDIDEAEFRRILALFPFLKIFKVKDIDWSCVQNLGSPEAMEAALRAPDGTVLSLNFADCNMGDSSADILIRNLRRFSLLQALDISNNQISLSKMVELINVCPEGLCRIQFKGNFLNYPGVNPLYAALERLIHLEELDFSGIIQFEHNMFKPNEGLDECGAMLEKMTALRRLTFGSTIMIRDFYRLHAGFKVIGPQLEELDFGIGGCDVEALPYCTQLKVLRAGWGGLGMESSMELLQILSKISTLRQVTFPKIYNSEREPWTSVVDAFGQLRQVEEFKVTLRLHSSRPDLASRWRPRPADKLSVEYDYIVTYTSNYTGSY